MKKMLSHKNKSLKEKILVLLQNDQQSLAACSKNNFTHNPPPPLSDRGGL